MDSMAQIPLKLEHLVKSYDAVTAVKDVSLEVQEREIFGLLGPNGAGKTSIISVLVTLEKPTAGQALVFGEDVVLHPELTKPKIGFVPQELINHGYFNVLEIMDYHAGFFGVHRPMEHIHYLLDRLQLWDHRFKKVKQLSGGMRRRLAIAKALVHSPKLLLLDEPTAGVDIELRTILWNFVRELRQQGLTILLTTHYLEEAEKLCDRVAIIHHGEILRVGPTQKLIEELTFRKITLKLNNTLSAIQHPWLTKQDKNALIFRVPAGQGLGDLLSELKLDVRFIADVVIEEGRLEDAFRSIVKGSEEPQ
jgi:ABC-2 type transport system ATP-binding protein